MGKPTYFEVIEGKNGLTVEVDVTHTHHFQPQHRDGSPFGVEMECDGWHPGRDATSAVMGFTPDQAEALGVVLIRAATRARDMEATRG